MGVYLSIFHKSQWLSYACFKRRATAVLSGVDCSTTRARRGFRRRATAGVSKTRVGVYFFFNPFTARVDDGVCDVVLTFTFVDKILWCDHSNEISLEVLSCGGVFLKKFYKMKFRIFVEFSFGHIWQ